MVRIRQRLTVAAVQRSWFEAYVSALHDLIEELVKRQDGAFVLLHGHGLVPGSTYRLAVGEEGPDDPALTVAAWDRAVETRIEASDEDNTVVLSLRSADRPVSGTLSCSMRDEGHLITWRAEIDAGRWWEQVEGWDRSDAPLRARIDHRYGAGAVEITCADASRDRWTVDVVVMVRGRWWLRPVLALAVLAFARESIRSACVEAGEGWDRWVADYAADEPRQAAERAMRIVTEEGISSKEWNKAFRSDSL